MRAKTAEVIDSAEAGAHPGHRYHRHQWHGPWGRPGERASLTLGNVIHFVIAACFLFPIFALIAVIWSLGDTINFVRHSVEALISSTFWLGRLTKEWMGGMYLHKNSPGMQRLVGQRKAFGAEAAKDWREAGRAVLNVGRAWSRTFGLGGLFNSLEQKLQHADQDWRRYVATQAYDHSQAPAEFPEQYVVVDELPRGGSSARLYIVRKADEPQGRLHVLKYFDLRAGGNLESVVRESQAAQLAQKLGLIVESKLGDTAFWYIMPYYSGETLTAGVMRNIKQARDNGTLNEHYRITLGYVHQLLQIIAQYHEAGVFHKDIKPDNLIINGEKIYLVDIGLMTPLSSMAQLTTHGTEYFRDPEMVKLALQGREVRQVDAAKFDVYSIGAVLFFALSGEFPTSGALSRLPREVPTAAQWVVNRAMTGMHQRYANARAMLTDIDYLTWAASQATLEQVKPADLPSFRGMPVPAHLQPQAPQNDTEWREKLSAAPGGYGAWYAAPAYSPRRRSSMKTALSVVLVFSVVSAICLGGIMMLFAARAPQPQIVSVEDGKKNNSATHLPPDSSKRELFVDIDKAIDRGIRVSGRSSAPVTPRINVSELAVSRIENVAEGWARDTSRRDRRRAKPPELAGNMRYAFICLEDSGNELELAKAIQFELSTRIEKNGSQLTVWDDERTTGIRQLLLLIDDRESLHKALASACAKADEAPPILVAVSVSPETKGHALILRMIYPGREHTETIRFADEAPALPPEGK